MKYTTVCVLLAILGLSSAASYSYPRGCIYANGRCVQECPVGTSSYTIDCGYVTREATCRNSRPKPDKQQTCGYSACHCVSPTVRDEASGQCVHLDKCPGAKIIHGHGHGGFPKIERRPVPQKPAPQRQTPQVQVAPPKAPQIAPPQVPQIARPQVPQIAPPQVPQIAPPQVPQIARPQVPQVAPVPTYNAGYNNANTGYTNYNSGYNNANTGYANNNGADTGYTNNNSGYKNYNSGYTNTNSGYANNAVPRV